MFGIGGLVDLAAVVAAKRYMNRQKVLETLENPGRASIRIPFVDDLTSRYAGKPDRKQKWAAKRIVAAARIAVQTRAFENVVAGFLNPKSKLRNGPRKCTNVSIYL